MALLTSVLQRRSATPEVPNLKCCAHGHRIALTKTFRASDNHDRCGPGYGISQTVSPQDSLVVDVGVEPRTVKDWKTIVLPVVPSGPKGFVNTNAPVARRSGPAHHFNRDQTCPVRNITAVYSLMHCAPTSSGTFDLNAKGTMYVLKHAARELVCAVIGQVITAERITRGGVTAAPSPHRRPGRRVRRSPTNPVVRHRWPPARGNGRAAGWRPAAEPPARRRRPVPAGCP